MADNLQWQIDIGVLKASLLRLETGQDALSKELSDLREHNERDHGGVRTDIERLRGEMISALEHASRSVKEANEALEVRNWIIRGLVAALVILGSMITGVKLHALGIVKDILKWPA